MSKDNIQRVKASELELKSTTVKVRRVAKVTKGGRTFSFSSIVVVGDGNGIVGHGLGKARDVAESIKKAEDDAKKNLIKVPIINGTVPHPIEGRYGGAWVLIKPASAGTGVKAGGAMRAVFESCGVTDVISKSLASTNPANVIKATLVALTNMRDAYSIAKERGISMEKLFK